MRPFIIGILLFLMWSSLSSWYYVKNIYPLNNPVEETQVSAVLPEPSESPEIIPELPEIPESFTLYFDYNKSELKNADAMGTFLTGSLDYLLADSSSCLVITGYTCALGSEEYNRKLGMDRAEAVREYLRTQGFSDKCLKSFSGGEQNPVSDNSSEESRRKNRRAELKIQNQN